MAETVEPPAEPSIEDLLKQSNWDEQLRLAREKRAQVLAARAEPTPIDRETMRQRLEDRMRALAEEGADLAGDVPPPIAPPIGPRRQPTSVLPPPMEMPVLVAFPDRRVPEVIPPAPPRRREPRTHVRLSWAVFGGALGITLGLALATPNPAVAPSVMPSAPSPVEGARTVVSPAPWVLTALGTAATRPTMQAAPLIEALAPSAWPDRAPVPPGDDRLRSTSVTADRDVIWPGPVRSPMGLGFLGAIDPASVALTVVLPAAAASLTPRYHRAIADAGYAATTAVSAGVTPVDAVVRVYHPEDLAEAQALAVATGAGVQPLMSYTPRPPLGQIDLLLPK